MASWLPATADATTASCPSPPVAYTGTDATVAALTSGQIDADQSCQALSDRLDALATDVDGLDSDVNTNAGQAHTDAEAIASDVNTVDTDVKGVSSTVSTEGGTTSTVELGSQTMANLDADANGLHVDLWTLVGVLIGVFALGEVLRKVWP